MCDGKLLGWHTCLFFHCLIFVNQKMSGSYLCSLFRQNTPGQTLRITQYWGAFTKQFLPWKSNKYYVFWLCVCSHTYPACNARAPYCYLWPVRLYHIFQHCLINCTIFRRKNYGTQYVFCFSLQLLSQTILSLRTVQSAVAINVNTSSFIDLVSLVCVRF